MQDEINNVRLENNIIYRDDDTLRNAKVVIIETNEDPTVPCILFSYTKTFVKNGHCILSTINEIDYDEDNVEDIYYNPDTQIILVRTRNGICMFPFVTKIILLSKPEYLQIVVQTLHVWIQIGQQKIFHHRSNK